MRKRLYTTEEVDINYDFDKELDDIINYIQKIKVSKSKTVDVDCEYDLDFDDLMDLIWDCSSFEKKEILNMLREDDSDTLIKSNTLYDDMKLRVLKVAFDKYSLDELQSRLDIKNNEY